MTEQPFRYEQDLPSRLETLNDIHPVLNRWTGCAGLDTAAGHRVAVAVTEAITNAIIHAHASCPEQSVLVRLWTDQNRLCAEVGDRGPQAWTVPPPDELVDWARTSGRGLALIRQIAHEFSITPRLRGGTMVRMTFLANECAAGKPHKDAAGTNVETAMDLSNQGERSMDYRVEKQESVDVLRITGRLDLVSSNNLKDCVRQRLGEKRTLLVLNMKGVDFINSSGLGALVSILKDVRLVNGRLVLSELAPYVQEIFAITQLSNVFEIHSTEQEAVQSVNAKPEPELVKN